MKLFITLSLLISSLAFADGVNNSFQGTRVDALIRPTTVQEYRGKVNPAGELIDYGPNGFDLTPQNTPDNSKQEASPDGNRLDSVHYITNENHYTDDDPLMDVYDNDFTLTVKFRIDSSFLGSAGYIVSKGSFGNDGMSVFINSGVTSFICRGTGGGGNASVSASALSDTAWHIGQAKRTSNTLEFFLDGVSQGTADVTSHCQDSALRFGVGGHVIGVSPITGEVSYVRVDREALSDERLAFEYDVLKGMATTELGAKWDVERSTVGYTTVGQGSIYESAPDAPRVSDGLLVEAQTTVLNGETEAMDNWFDVGTCAVTADTRLSPAGTLTMDTVDNTGDVAGYRWLNTAALGGLAGRTFTFSFWAIADTPHIFTVWLVENGIGQTAGTFWVDNTPRRYSVIRTMVGGGGDNQPRVQFYPGEKDVAVGILDVWGMNITETTYPVSYIPNAGSRTSQVTRVADDVTMDPHEAGTSKIVLPLAYTPTVSTDLTIYLEAKCHWSSSADIGSVRSLLEIGGDTGVSMTSRNRITVYTSTNGKATGLFRDDSDADHSVTSAVNPVDYSDWFSVRYYLDFSDLSNMELWVSDSTASNAYAGNAGTATFDTTNSLIRLGQEFDGDVEADCAIRNLRIHNAKVEP